MKTVENDIDSPNPKLEEIQTLLIECKKGIYNKNLKAFHEEWQKVVKAYPPKRWWEFWRKKPPTFRNWIIKMHEKRVNNPLWDATMSYLTTDVNMHIIESLFEDGVIRFTHEQSLEIRKLQKIQRELEKYKNFSDLAKKIRNRAVLRTLGDI